MAKTPKPWFRKGRGWFVTIGGKQYNLGREKKAANQEYFRLMRLPTAGRQVTGRSFVAIIDDFLEFVMNNFSQATYSWYQPLLQKFIVEHKDLSIDDIRPYHVQRWVDGFSHLAKTSRRNHIRAVKRCVKWAMSQGYIDKNPLQYLPVPAPERKESLVSDSDYRLMLNYASSDSLRDLLVTTWETGCRPQESLRVEARHVDAVNQRWVIPTSEAKGQKMVRIVYLTDRAFEITRRLVMKFPEGKLFRNSNCLPWTPAAVNCAIDRIRIRIGKAEMKRQAIAVANEDIESLVPKLKNTRRVRGIERPKTDSELKMEAKAKLANKLAFSMVPRHSLYAFRHTFATRALQRGVDSVTVAVLLGHTDPSMLAKVYQHLSQDPSFMLAQAKKAKAIA